MILLLLNGVAWHLVDFFPRQLQFSYKLVVVYLERGELVVDLAILLLDQLQFTRVLLEGVQLSCKSGPLCLIIIDFLLLLVSDLKKFISLCNSVLIDGFVFLKHAFQVCQLGFGPLQLGVDPSDGPGV